MRVLVTGGCGFIGSAVCRHYVGVGAHVVNIDKMTYAATEGSTAGLPDTHYTHLRADIGDPAAMAAAFDGFKPDVVIHLAAESHVDRSISGPDAFITTNIVGTFQLLNAARHYWERLAAEAAERFRFLHVSTDEVYGALGVGGAFTETTRYAPTSPYSASKAGSDHLALAWRHTYGLPVIISNCSNNYGPFQFPEKLIPLTIINARLGRPLPVYGAGTNVRDWLHVDDHVDALDTVLTHGAPGQSYNIGSRNERTNIELVRTLCALMDEIAPSMSPHSNLIRFVEDRPGHDHRYAIDPTKLERELGWRSRRSFKDGLRETLNWYLDNETWWGPIRQRDGDVRLGLLPEPIAQG